jgi:hypothetical protein
MRYTIVLASLFLSAGSALGDAGSGSDAARAPMSYTLTDKWRGTARATKTTYPLVGKGKRVARATNLLDLVTLDAAGVHYWHTDVPGAGATSPGTAVVLYPDGTARLTAQKGVSYPGTYRRAGSRIHIRFRIPPPWGTWLWDLEYVGPGKWGLVERPDR